MSRTGAVLKFARRFSAAAEWLVFADVRTRDRDENPETRDFASVDYAIKVSLSRAARPRAGRRPQRRQRQDRANAVSFVDQNAGQMSKVSVAVGTTHQL